VDELLSWDREHLWHPYSSMTAAASVHEVESASGVRLRMRRNGSLVEVVDAMSSWWCAVNGYAVPELDAAAADQLTRMSHVMFGGLTHRPAVELGRRLLDLAGLEQVFLADSGSVSVEVAMKMAWQAHAAGGLTRTRMFTIRGGYHGDTFSPMSVCDPDGGMHSMYAGLLPEHVFAPRPPGGLDRACDDPEVLAWESETRTLFEQHADEIAAVIIEPVLQGAGGMWVYPARCADFLARLARQHGVTGVRVFGSMVRGDAGPDSDVDVLVEVGPEPSAWFPGGLVADLEALLGRRVQVVTDRKASVVHDVA